MSTTHAAKAAEILELQERVDALTKELKVLREFIVKADPIIAAVKDMVSVYGTYRGSDNRVVPAVIVAAFPRAGTVDAFVFDSSYSGGSYQLTGIEIGAAKGQVIPYLPAEIEAEAAEHELVAGKS